MPPSLSHWLGWGTLIALTLSSVTSIIVAHAFDITMAASSLLVLNAMWHQLVELISQLHLGFFAFLERNGMSPSLLYLLLAIQFSPHLRQAVIKVPTAVGIAQTYAYYKHQRDDTIDQLQQQLAEYVEPKIVQALKRAQKNHVDELEKKIEGNEDEIKITKSAEAGWRRNYEELELRHEKMQKTYDPGAVRIERDKDRKSLCEAWNKVALLEDEVLRLKQEAVEVHQHNDCERQVTANYNDQEQQKLVNDHNGTIREKDQLIEQQTAAIRRLEMEGELTTHNKQEVIDQQASTIVLLEQQASERDAECHKLQSQLKSIKSIIFTMVDGEDEVETDVGVLFISALRRHGTDLYELGVDLELFEKLLGWVRDKHFNASRSSGFEATPPTTDRPTAAMTPQFDGGNVQRAPNPVLPQGSANPILPFTVNPALNPVGIASMPTHISTSSLSGAGEDTSSSRSSRAFRHRSQDVLF
ncbi:hypothetical protein G6514_009449 [Epicoccum nigrum]|nr:hypothetical protein G6514_009449 [Epicoccum nigrum]